MYKVLTLCLLMLSSGLHAQQVALPRRLDLSDTAFRTKMAGLSRQLIATTSYTPGEAYFDKMFRLEMIAGDYAASLRHLDSFSTLYRHGGNTSKTVAHIQYRAYLASVLNGALPESAGFAATYTERLAAMYDETPPELQSQIHRYFPPDTGTATRFLRIELAAVSGRKKLPLAAAERLLRSYLAWDVYRQVLGPAKAFLDAARRRKYYSSDTTRIRLPDGASLSAVIVRPRAVDGPLPVVLVYNIYAGPMDLAAAQGAADHGYAGVVVNTRGKRLSDDAILPFEHDAEDAWHAIDWISRQPWCNGKIGMYGGSYLGFSQWAAVKRLHPALKTIVPQTAVGIGVDFPALNGIFSSYMLRWIHYVTNNRFTDDAEFSDQARWNQRYQQWYRSGRSFRALDSIDSRPSPVFQRWLDHPTYDAYWRTMVPDEAALASLNIPVLTITGYFDSDQQGALHYVREHYRQNPHAQHYVLLGPYDHGGAQYLPADTVEGYRIDPVAKLNILETVFDWFDYTLKDSARPAILQDKVVYQPMGTNTWRGAASLDALSNDSLAFYPGSEGAKHGLSGPAPRAAASFHQKLKYRPKTYSATSGRVLSRGLPPGRRLVFTSAPLERELLMNGAPGGELHVIVNKQDADLKADLYELRADGSYFRLSTFSGRASCMQDPSRRILLQPGVEARVPIRNADLTSKLLAKGSKIVLVLGVSNSPWAQVNYGSGKDVSDETVADGKVPLQIEWLNSTRIVLPVLQGTAGKLIGKD